MIQCVKCGAYVVGSISDHYFYAHSEERPQGKGSE